VNQLNSAAITTAIRYINTKKKEKKQRQCHEQGLNRFYLLTIMRGEARGAVEQSKPNQMINDNTKTQLAYEIRAIGVKEEERPVHKPIPMPIPNRNPKSQSATLWQSSICVHWKIHLVLSRQAKGFYKILLTILIATYNIRY